MTVPRIDSVAALYCLQNSMVCTPWGPSAVPTGGAGVAPPASSWILTTATPFLAMAVRRVVLLTDLHGLHTVGPERGPPRGRGRRATRLELNLDDCDDVLGHGR